MSPTALVELLHGTRIAVLTGAGISTESGIPDYRGAGTRARARNPIQHRAFVTDPATRRRYWARAAIGWERFSTAVPNEGHLALAELERRGVVLGVVTQNVDRLHQRAGSTRVIELHGALASVRCLGCDALTAREDIQTRILSANPGLSGEAALAPDGDAEVEATEGFVVPDCLRCGGVLKPDVVFFGDNVPRARVEAAFACVDAADVLLVVGSSLAVFSGYRFVLRAKERGQPIALVNLGGSRADGIVDVRVEGRAGEVLPALARAL